MVRRGQRAGPSVIGWGMALAGIVLPALAQTVEQRTQAVATPPEITIQDTPTGSVFADISGYTLYVTERDTEPDTSTCVGPCAAEWPPVRAATDAIPFGDWSLVPRADGPPQWAYKGRPLYRYLREARPRWAEAHSAVWYIATTDPFPVRGGRVRYGRYSLVTEDRLAVSGAPGGIAGQLTPSGPVFADRNGMTLYMRRSGDPCLDQCLETWSPLAAPMAAIPTGEWTIEPHMLGTRVWAHGGQVVYRCARDTAPGETNCDGAEAGGRVFRVPPAARD